MTWIFGYGSLIWRPGFTYSERRKASVRGWRRRFWQASPDHRGVPGAPGRVVTLVEDPDAVCWGVAFLLDDDDHAIVMPELDYREKNGYERIDVELRFEQDAPGQGLTYIAGPANPSYIGPAPLEQMAAQIERSAGPSGSNLEYLMKLAESLDALGVCDEEVHGLRAILQSTVVR